MSEKQPFIHISAFKGAEFNINGETKSYSIMELFKFQDFLKGHLKTCAYLWRDLNYYKDFETKVEQILTEQNNTKELDEAFDIVDIVDEEEEFQYSIGDNYAKFLEVSDNNKAAEILKKEYTKEFGQNTLEFDPESSYCYVYTEDREEAKQFLLFVYEKYIKSYLEPWYDGFDDFATEFKNSTPEERSMFDHLSW